MIRVGIVGAGPMGRLHAAVVARLGKRDSRFELTCIHDHHEGRAEAVAEDFGARASDSLGDLENSVDAVIVAVPTAAHFDVAFTLLEGGTDLLIEKPLARDLREGRRLEQAAAAHSRIVQVGHVEWYNPAWRACVAKVGELRRIEVVRIQPYSARGRDVDVVQDLMLHDLDWTTRWIGSPVTHIEARSRRPLGQNGSDTLDHVEAKLLFESGCEVSLVADRAAKTRRREARFEGSLGSASTLLDLVSDRTAGGVSNAPDPLERQWLDFIQSIETRVAPENSVGVGVRALEWVERVREAASGHDPDLGG